MSIKLCRDHPARIYTNEMPIENCEECGKPLVDPDTDEPPRPQIIKRILCSTGDGTELIWARCEEDTCEMAQIRDRQGVILGEVHFKEGRLGIHNDQDSEQERGA